VHAGGVPVPRATLRIGELARLAGLSPDTLRHYERLGLLSATRTPGQFREYGPEALRRVRVIQAALVIGFGLGELSQVFAERAAGRPPCKRVRAMAGEKLEELSRRIEELTRLRAQLAGTLASWDARLASTRGQAPAYLLDSLVEEKASTTSATTRRAFGKSSGKGRR
jgi:DNA-binding transcriptional MerR regulator